MTNYSIKKIDFFYEETKKLDLLKIRKRIKLIPNIIKTTTSDIQNHFKVFDPRVGDVHKVEGYFN